MAIVVASACGDGRARRAATPQRETTTTATTTTLPASAGAYLDVALDAISGNAYYADRIDWTAERVAAHAMAAGAATFADTYPAIRAVLADLRDGHSQFVTPQQAAHNQPGVLPAGTPDVRTVAPGVASLRVPGFVGPQQSPGADRYVAAAEAALRSASPPCGWILDLRGNGGGNLVPMIVSAGPLLGEGDAMRVRDRDGVARAFAYRDGQLFYAGTRVAGPRNRLAPLDQSRAIAALVDGATASAGEQLALAVRGRHRGQLFGAPTAGQNSGNALFPLPDGAQIILTTTVAEDLQGNRYDGPVEPDVATDNAEAAAVQWLGTTPGCRTPG